MVALRVVGIVILSLAVPALVFAAGAHDGLGCVGCHGIHNAKGDIIFAPFTGITALCLGCHETIDKGGMGIAAVSSKHSHPYGVTPNPKVATVPGVFLRGGNLECVGCHDPHPSNQNYKYLRVDTAKGAKIGDFCGMCHASKADPAAVKQMKIFNSMDERKAPAAAPAPAPMKKKK
jgi:predicted CXXCH cytochrome family protein